jgi:hypothetical protein
MLMTLLLRSLALVPHQRIPSVIALITEFTDFVTLKTKVTVLFLILKLKGNYNGNTIIAL